MRQVRGGLWLTFAAACLMLACTTTRTQMPADGRGEAAPELSRKLSTYVYIEEGGDLIFTIGVRAAAFHEESPFFPLEVSVANKQKGTTWVLRRESFTLYDEEGRAYGMPTQPELADSYYRRTFDAKLFDARSVTAQKHEGYRLVDSNFFPDPFGGITGGPVTVPGGAAVPPASRSLTPSERVELSAMSFMQDVLYFPHPDGDLTGARFSLELRAEGLAEPARIAFRIPKL
jgi:hypothetical protein